MSELLLTRTAKSPSRAVMRTAQRAHTRIFIHIILNAYIYIHIYISKMGPGFKKTAILVQDGLYTAGTASSNYIRSLLKVLEQQGQVYRFRHTLKTFGI